MESYNAAGILEKLTEVADALLEYSNKYSGNVDDSTELKVLSDTVKSIVNILDTEAAPIEIYNNIELGNRLNVSIIDKLGIGGEVVRLRKQGHTIAQIAAQFKLDTTTISRFFKYYDKQSTKAKLKYEGRSVFETTERLEELQTIILRNIHRLEGDKDDVAVKYVTELRQTLALAVNITEKMANAKALDELKELVVTVLTSELPHRRKEILLQLKSIMTLSGYNMPGG